MALRYPNLNEDVTAYDKLQTDEINKIADYVVESGSNPNGRYEKWASGKMVQRGSFTLAAANPLNVTFPISFLTSQQVNISGDYVGGLADSVNYLYTRSGVGIHGTGVFIRDIRTGLAPTGTVSFSYIAYGTWK